MFVTAPDAPQNSVTKKVDSMTQHPDHFLRRHIGPNAAETVAMLQALSLPSLDVLIDTAVPAGIRLGRSLNLPPALSEYEALASLRSIAARNQVFRSYLGMGYHDCLVPPVIQRNVLENPGWYTQYTPYQSEISQGRLESLLNFQTMVCDLTGMEIANASMLDEATAAAEAMAMAKALCKNPDARTILVSSGCHPQTREVVRTRAETLGLKMVDEQGYSESPSEKVFALLMQYPDTAGAVLDRADCAASAHEGGAMVIVATDLLALTLLKPPGEWGADIVVGSSQRFGVPLGYGGPHAAFLATRDAFKRQMPGRLVGVSKDSRGKPALRLTLGTREQHIRRDKATSNICTAQALLANMAALYACYHGPDGLKAIAARLHLLAKTLAAGLEKLGHRITHATFFDTLRVELKGSSVAQIVKIAEAHRINLRVLGDGAIGIALDETTSAADVAELWQILNNDKAAAFAVDEIAATVSSEFTAPLSRTSKFLQHAVFNRHHSETEMLRYLRKLESRDLSLCHSMIPLGSCTMKLNATAEMFPVSWPEFAKLHPFAPVRQAQGYQQLFNELETWLAEITGFAGVSLQPNAGSQGEYAGLLVIRKWHESRGESGRNICLIPASAHGTNPASAVMAGMIVVPVACDAEGDISLTNLRAKADEHKADLSCLMVTYPSTHGVFEETIREICEVIHAHGGQVYMDGANMNAQVGLTSPGFIGADVCHLNLHKTFCIPHGGGGPGMGPIGVKAHLAPFLPGHPLTRPDAPVGPVSAAPYGSASILPISYTYIRMMGGAGLKRATEVAILNANYIASRLDAHFPVLYKNHNGRVAHECILDPRPLKDLCGVTVDDIAKRLIDYGFHAPTMSFPVPGTLMNEPTESESKYELDRFIDAMIAIRKEIAEVEGGRFKIEDSPLRHAPHTTQCIAQETWTRPYARTEGCFPVGSAKADKYWPPVSRIDNVYGDRNLVCVCPPMEEYADAKA